MALEFQDLTETIIGAGITVHKVLGPGFKESVYQKALLIELGKRALKVSREYPLVIRYEGIVVGRQKLDLMVNDLIIVETKVVRELIDVHYAQLRSYLKAAGCKHGLLLNFAKVKLEMKRVIYDPDHPTG